MKKIITLLAIVLFTINVGAQQTKHVATETKKESCCAKASTNAKKMSTDEVAKGKAKCKAEGKVCTANEKAKCKKDEKKCCAKKA
ncbi:hypothetical protein [Flavobacterium soyangense]|uniref:Uncharacterized protein n=1 Tax=Flavobacterium soyangense TaxID=2023265 RepID=A0A930Y167_9FLAO|nr:hypothetical protein [Flavobacterium soyangense]MBF2709144.1 hypothetical protein [Flavobacterium soyangense]